MTAVLFIGPSLQADEARALYGRDGLHLLPPAEQGDVLRALSLAPRVIGLVDGRFDGVPAVLHKEILYALHAGVHVLGAASMGALRAAELQVFGMRGIGAIFEAYRDGRLDGDDAVALLHAGPEHGYRPLSEPLVDIQATLLAASRAGVLDAPAGRRLAEAARALDYGRRQWDTLLAGADEHLERSRLDALRAWLACGRVHAKREDARRLVRSMRALMETGPPRFAADFELQRSHHWEAFRARHEHSPPGADDHAVLDELRLDETAWRHLRDAALLRLLARREAARQDIGSEPLDPATPLAALRRRHALTRRADLDRWLRENGLDSGRLLDALNDTAAIERLCALLGEQLDGAVLAEAALQGVLPPLRRRAADKRALLTGAGAGRDNAPPAALLLEWFFNERGGLPVPADLGAHAAMLGLADSAELVQLLRQEYLYWAATSAVEDGTGGRTRGGS